MKAPPKVSLIALLSVVGCGDAVCPRIVEAEATCSASVTGIEVSTSQRASAEEHCQRWLTSEKYSFAPSALEAYINCLNGLDCSTQQAAVEGSLECRASHLGRVKEN